MFLRQLGKRVAMINKDPVPETLSWMAGAERIEVFDGRLAQLRCLRGADAIIMVDLNAGRRLGRTLARPVRESPARKVLIDHHQNPEKWFDCSFVRGDAAATAMLVYELITAWDSALLTGDIATALYVAILTDTGMFRYTTVTPSVHRVVADLLEISPLSAAQVHAAIYETRTPEWPRLLARVMNTLTLRYGGALAYIVVAQRALRDTAVEYQDTEGFIDFAMSVDGVRIALVFTETQQGVKVSFRSKRDHAVDHWARSLGGGGHRNAAGAFVRGQLDQVIGRVVASAPRYASLPGMHEDPAITSEDEHYLNLLTGTQ